MNLFLSLMLTPPKQKTNWDVSGWLLWCCSETLTARPKGDRAIDGRAVSDPPYPHYSTSQAFLLYAQCNSINWPWWGNTWPFLSNRIKLASFYLRRDTEERKWRWGYRFHISQIIKRKMVIYYLNLNYISSSHKHNCNLDTIWVFIFWWGGRLR